MPDITITPGTFNPPAALGVVHGFIDFPKTPVQQVKRPALQYNSRWVEEGEPSPPPPAISQPVIYSYSDFATGFVSIQVHGDVTTFNAAAPSLVTAGVRYIPDGTYAITGPGVLPKSYEATGAPQITIIGVMEMDIGTVTVGGADGVGPIGFNNILATIDYSLILAGSADGAIYTLQALGSTTPTAASGTIEIGVGWPVAPETNGWIDQPMETVTPLVFTLLRAGLPFDRVYIGIKIVGSIHFVAGPAIRPTVPTGQSVTETLYRQGEVGVFTAPEIPYVSYVREGWAAQGNITLP